MADIAFIIHRANTESCEYDVTLPVPHPFHTTDSGLIVEHALMEGGRILGFMKTPEPSTLDLPWAAFTEDPDSAVGLYIVTVEPDGNLSSWGLPVRKVDDLRSDR